MNCNRKYLHSKNLCCQTWNFCIYHRIFGYKSKTKNVTCGFILQYARLKAITCTIFKTPMKNVTTMELNLILIDFMGWYQGSYQCSKGKSDERKSYPLMQCQDMDQFKGLSIPTCGKNIYFLLIIFPIIPLQSWTVTIVYGRYL